MKRLAVLVAVLLGLAACVPAPVSRAPSVAASVPVQCRVGPDGGAPLVERGIGGTGAPVTKTTDRGIGGTGAPSVRTADRGIGGTGITGIVSGFASVCVDGLEVALGDQVAVDIDGTSDSLAALRVGQLVAITASPSAPSPIASKVSVRHEVSGPVEAVLRVDPGLIVVAGQRVRVPGKTAGALLVQPGVWVAVSGLRGPDGDIVASRLDPRSPGRVLVHGPLIAADGVATIGSLEIRTRRDTRAEVGTYVTVLGTYQDGILSAENLVPDLLVSNPPAYFGTGTKHLVLESYGRFESGTATISGGFQAALSSGFQPPGSVTGPVVMSLEAQSDGSFTVLHATPALAPAVPAATPDTTHTSPGAGGMSHPNGGTMIQPAYQTAGISSTAPMQVAPSAGMVVGTVVSPTAPATGLYSRQPPQQPMRIAIPVGNGGGPVAGGIVYAPTQAGVGAIQGGAIVAAGGGARIGGIRLMGVGLGGIAGHAGAGMIAPKAMGIHLHSIRFWPGH